MTKRPVADIIVGTRHRKDMGDIAGLAASLAELSLLHPIVVRPDGVLIAGEPNPSTAAPLPYVFIKSSCADGFVLAQVTS
jgi:hypothetical protein